MAYGLAGREAGQLFAEGRYLYLQPNALDAARCVTARADDDSLAEAFESALRPIFEGIDRGACFPRLVDPVKEEEPRACAYCDVRQACLRGDSGARRRLVSWSRDHSAPGAPESGPVERALLNVWRLREVPR